MELREFLVVLLDLLLLRLDEARAVCRLVLGLVEFRYGLRMELLD